MSNLLKSFRWLTPAVAILVAIVSFIFFAAPVAAQEVQGQCAGIAYAGTQAAVDAVSAQLGCTAAAPTLAPAVALDEAAGKMCTVVSSSNLRAGPGMRFAVVGGASRGQQFTTIALEGDGGWWKLTRGKGYIASWLCSLDGPVMASTPSVTGTIATSATLPVLRVWIPPTIETAPRKCQAYVRADGFHMDKAVSASDGKEYDVTIVSSTPDDGDLCDPLRIVQDGANSSMIQDLLSQPPGTRPASWERDFTFLSQDWTGVQWAYYAGVACRIEIDADRNPNTPREPVLDENGAPVGYTHGTQRFAPVVGGWYNSICDKNASVAGGIRIDRQPWTR